MTSDTYIMALDVGDKRIGVAIAHSVARLPRPLTTLIRSGRTLEDIRQLVAQEQVGLLVVGLPRGMDGGYTAQTRSTEAFKRELEAAVSVPVELADETLTTVHAAADLQGTDYSRAELDAVAASVILESYLREHQPVNGAGV